eukprot:2074696-Pleurochrysis_carterae.AAC.1
MPTPVSSLAAMDVSSSTSAAAPSLLPGESDVQSELLKMLEARVEIRLASFFECCIEHWSYMTTKDYDPDDPAVRTERKAKCMSLARRLLMPLLTSWAASRSAHTFTT